MIDTIKIDGKDVELKIRYKDINRMLKRFNKVYYIASLDVSKEDRKAQADAIKEGKPAPEVPIFIPNSFFIWVLWQIIPHKGLFFKKPFRSKRHIKSLILQGEFAGIVNVISTRILDMKTGEDKKPGNLTANLRLMDG